MNELSLVKASIKDSRIIWEWRNDTNTRLMFFENSKISWEDHMSWFKNALEDKNRIIYMGLTKDKPIGIIRFDRDPKNSFSFKISINIDPNSRSKGYGKMLLNKGLKKFLKNHSESKIINAEIKKNNQISKKIFISCGFSLSKSKNNFDIYELKIKDSIPDLKLLLSTIFYSITSAFSV